MPKINIYLKDNTGAEYTGDEQVIFIPGPIAIKDKQADDHKCVYIPASKVSKASTEYLEFIDVAEITSKLEMLDKALSEKVEATAEVIEAVNAEAAAKKELDDAEESEKTNKQKAYDDAVKATVAARKAAIEANNKDLLEYVRKEALRVGLTSTATEDALKAAIAVDAQGRVTGSAETIIEKQLSCLALIESYLSMNYDVIYCNIADLSDVEFLLDKDSYNIKFLTAGLFGCINTEFTSKGPQENDSKNLITFDFGNLNTLTKIAAKRKDCLVIADIKYDAASCTSFKVTGDVLADCFKVACSLTKQETQDINVVEETVTIAVSKVLEKNLTETSGIFEGMTRFASVLFPNIITTITTTKGKVEDFTVPAGYAYLSALAECRKNNQYWLPVANSARGQVSEMTGTPDLTVTKYHLDNSIILDSDAITFNGIVKIRPYGNVIWGDRTLLPLDEKGIKASVYLSLMSAVCDISKEAYKASVRSTYESNNEVTWLNYKSGIADLLDQMVSAGIIQSYDLNKVTAAEYNKIICKITLYPNLPVENFDVYINLENAELQLENA